MNYYIGADLGTSSIKLLLVDCKGNVCNQVSESYPIFFPKENFSEQNPSDWFDAFKKGIKKLVKGYKPNDIKALSIAGQMHGLVILDKYDNVIRPAILWNDGRSIAETNYLNDMIGKDKMVQMTGNFAFPGFTLPKIMWVRNHEPNNFDKIDKIMLPKDFIIYMLTGNFVSDYSDSAGTLMLDVKNKIWNKELCKKFHIKDSMLPELHESFDIVGLIKQDIAKELGLSFDIKVVMGAGDNAGAAIGNGCIDDGDCNISLGTSGTIFVSSKKFVNVGDAPIHSFNHANGKFHIMACILTAASANKWFTEDILNKNYKRLANIDSKSLGENNVIFLPYLMGERCPYNDPNASGAFIGLRANTTELEMSQAVLEGVCFALRDCFHLIEKLGVDVKRITICGGGCNTKIWPVILSNVLNKDLVYLKTEQGPSYGAAILGMIACGEFKNLQEAKNILIKDAGSVRPTESIVKKYNNLYKRYHKLYDVLKIIG